MNKFLALTLLLSLVSFTTKAQKELDNIDFGDLDINDERAKLM